MHLGPTQDQIAHFVAGDLDEPVVMLNLLRFADRADRGSGSDESGQDSYRRYGERVVQMVEAIGGKVVWLGRAHAPLIGPEAEHWDTIVLVRYPSRRAFIEMTSSGEYKEAASDRTAGLVDSRLVPMTELLSDPS